VNLAVSQHARRASAITPAREQLPQRIGPIELSVLDKQTVNVPVWAGISAIVIGAALLVFNGRRG
jgi:hypothetical protein